MTVMRGSPSLPRTVQGAALLLAPLLQAISTLLWTEGQFEYGPTSGTVLALALVSWVVGLVGVIDMLSTRAPITAAVTLPLMVYGAMGGINFAFRGFYESAAGISHEAGLQTLASVPMQANVLLWWPGPLFPLVLLILGATLWRTRTVTPWVAALICLGAIAFPFGRATRIQTIALVTDLLLLIPFALVGLRLPRMEQPPTPTDEALRSTGVR